MSPINSMFSRSCRSDIYQTAQSSYKLSMVSVVVSEEPEEEVSGHVRAPFFGLHVANLGT